MAETLDPRPVAPLFTFRFHVRFERVTLDGLGGGSGPQAQPLCEGAFSEITGLEATLEPKTIKEGGINHGAHQRMGQVSYGTVVLKRGITRSRDLWSWWALVAGSPDPLNDKNNKAGNGAYAQRLQVTISMQDSDGSTAMAWQLDRAMPVKFKAADFNGRAAGMDV